MCRYSFFFTLQLTVSNILKKKLYFIQSDCLSFEWFNSLSTNSIGKAGRYLFFRIGNLAWKVYLAVEIVRCDDESGCHKRYVIRNVADESDEDSTEQSQWRSNDVHGVRSLSDFVVRSYFRFFIERPPSGTKGPSFFFLKSRRKSTSAARIFALTASSTGPEAPATRLNASSP